jgi:GH24 family phage-related lysozyme (muramidase)
LVVFTFNVGPGGLGRNSTVRQELNAGNFQAAADAMLLYNRLTRNGQRVADPGLTNRRRSERALFLRGTR